MRNTGEADQAIQPTHHIDFMQQGKLQLTPAIKTLMNHYILAMRCAIIEVFLLCMQIE